MKTSVKIVFFFSTLGSPTLERQERHPEYEQLLTQTNFTHSTGKKGVNIFFTNVLLKNLYSKIVH